EHAAAFTVTGPPLLLVEPRDTSALLGGQVELKVGVSGQGPLFYQWLFNGAPLAGATNAALVFSGVRTNQAGAYSVSVSNALGAISSSVVVLNVVRATPFRIASLSTASPQIINHNGITGDDRGGIAVSRTQVFYTGDLGTGRFSATNLSGGRALGQLYDALVSNLRTEKVYTLADGTNLVSGVSGTNGASSTVTALIEIDGSTGALTANRLDLSAPIPLGFDTGIFAGYDAVVLHTGGRVYRIALPSGVVLDLGPMASFFHSSCENWAYWGVA